MLKPNRFSLRDLWDTAHLVARLAERQLGETESFAWFLILMAFDWLQFTAIRVTTRPVVSEWVTCLGFFEPFISGGRLGGLKGDAAA
jgi:hypothetical protein